MENIQKSEGDYSINYKCTKCNTTFKLCSSTYETQLAGKNFDYKCKLEDHRKHEKEYASNLTKDEYNLLTSKIKEGTNLINRYLGIIPNLFEQPIWLTLR